MKKHVSFVIVVCAYPFEFHASLDPLPPTVDTFNTHRQIQIGNNETRNKSASHARVNTKTNMQKQRQATN
jgi:hypothetical protein